MSEVSNPGADLREEYDFTPEELRAGIRGKYAARFREGVNRVPIDPDLRVQAQDDHAL